MFRVESCLALCSRVVLFSIVITSLGEERTGICRVLFVHLFVYFGCVNVCPFSLPFRVRDWLRFVIVALPGLLYYLYCTTFINNSTQNTPRVI